MDYDVLGFIAATLTTVAFLPQALKIIRTRDTRAISLSMYVTFTIGIALWLGYGVALNSWPMILSNASRASAGGDNPHVQADIRISIFNSARTGQSRIATLLGVQKPWVSNRAHSVQHPKSNV